MTAQTNATNPHSDQHHNPQPLPTWQVADNPHDAMADHMRRARGILSFVHFAFRQWSNVAFELQKADPGKLPSLDLYLPDARGLTEVLAAAGEAMELAEQAAQAAIQEGRRARGDKGGGA